MEENTRKEIKVALEGGGGFANMAHLLDKEWPKDVYARTKVMPDTPTNLGAEGDIAIILDPESTERNQTLENLKMMHPDLKEIISKNEGELDYTVKTTVVRSKDQQTYEKTSATYILPVKVNKDGVNRMDEIFELLRELK